MKNNEIVDLLKKRLHLNVQYTDTPLEYRGKVPFLLKKSYDTQTIKIEDLDFVILTVDAEKIQSVKKHFKLFSEALCFPVILYIENISTSIQRYLLENHIPFISKESIYLPQLLIYLKEKIAQKPLNRKPLSKLAQQVLLFHILHQKRQHIEIQAVAEQFSVTTMSASRALKELGEYELFSFEEIGRKKVYAVRDDLNFDDCISLLKNPKVGEVYLKSDELIFLEHKSLASLSALSHYANILSAETIYAVDKGYFDEQIKNHREIIVYEKQYDRELVKVELWNYPPESIQKNIIDPISLYRTLQDEMESEDTRLLNAFNELKEKIEGMMIDTWYREV